MVITDGSSVERFGLLFSRDARLGQNYVGSRHDGRRNRTNNPSDGSSALFNANGDDDCNKEAYTSRYNGFRPIHV